MYKKSTYGWLKDWDFILLDLLCMQVAFRAAYVLCSRFYFLSEQLYRSETVILALCQISVCFLFSPFRDILRRGYLIEAGETIKYIILVMLLAVFYLFVTEQFGNDPRILFLVTAVLSSVLVYLARIFRKKYLLKKGRSSVGKQSLIVLTVSDLAEEVIFGLESNPYDNFMIRGVVLLDQDRTGQQVSDIPVVAAGENVLDYVCHEWVDEVFIKVPDSMEYPMNLINSFILMGVTVHLTLSKVENINEGKQLVEYLGSETVLTTSISMAAPKQLLYKRMMDIMGGIVGCLLTAVLFLFLAPAIYIRSPGPIFFSQVRIGQNGRRFKIYKFRSMYVDAEAKKKELMEQNKVQGRPLMFKMDSDPRIIGSGRKNSRGVPQGIGYFIRRTSLDEFPQFWNVLKGEMSLVGTRPPTVDEWEQYSPQDRTRMAIKPGITGLWQVSGRSDITDFEEVVKLDTKYIKNWTIGLDCRIILKTIGVIFNRNGAA